MNPIVSINWIDSASSYGWCPPGDCYTPLRIRSVGFLVEQTRDTIAITTSLDEQGKALDVICIPRRAVISVNLGARNATPKGTKCQTRSSSPTNRRRRR